MNQVIGVPGETWDDIEEGIQLAIKCKPFIEEWRILTPLCY